MGDLGSRMNDVNNDVQLLLARFGMAVEVLQMWIDEHPDEHLGRHTRSYLKHWGQASDAPAAAGSPETGEQP